MKPNMHSEHSYSTRILHSFYLEEVKAIRTRLHYYILGGSPSQYIQVGGGRGEITPPPPPKFAGIEAYVCKIVQLYQIYHVNRSV